MVAKLTKGRECECGRVEDNTCQVGGLRPLILPSVRWVAAQERAALRQSGAPAASTALERLDSETQGLEETVIRRIESQLLELVHAEVRGVYETALQAEQTHPGLPKSPTPESTEKKPSPFHVPPVRLHTADAASGTVSSRARPAPKRAPASIPWLGRRRRGIGFSAAGVDSEYEGNVMLWLGPNASIAQVVRFVRELSREPRIRLLRLGGRHEREDIGIWLALRQPLDLKQILLGIDVVSGVSITPISEKPGTDPILTVELIDPPGTLPRVTPITSQA